jgi:hypothetical protein
MTRGITVGSTLTGVLASKGQTLSDELKLQGQVRA